MNLPVGYIKEINGGPVTVHISTLVDKETKRGYYGICTTYPNLQRKRWGLIKDLKYQVDGELEYITDPIRSEAIAFLIAFSSIHDSHKNILTVSNSTIIKNIIENTDLDPDTLDVVNRIRTLENDKNTISQFREPRKDDIELIKILDYKLEKYRLNDRHNLSSRSSI